VLISEQHPTFLRSGLKKTSLLKAEKIAVVHESIFQRKLGSLPVAFLTQVQEALKKALLLS
jgi:mRNA interferase MazF